MNYRGSVIRPLSNRGTKDYSCLMASAWKLVLLIAVLLMPFGMAPASAAPVHDAPMTAMPMGHCPDQSSHHDGMKGGIAECTMACAAALPASAGASDCLLASVPEPAFAAASASLHGLQPDTATPPPRRS